MEENRHQYKVGNRVKRIGDYLVHSEREAGLVTGSVGIISNIDGPSDIRDGVVAVEWQVSDGRIFTERYGGPNRYSMLQYIPPEKPQPQYTNRWEDLEIE